MNVATLLGTDIKTTLAPMLSQRCHDIGALGGLVSHRCQATADCLSQLWPISIPIPNFRWEAQPRNGQHHVLMAKDISASSETLMSVVSKCML